LKNEQYLIRLDELLFMGQKKNSGIESPLKTYFVGSLSMVERILCLALLLEML